MQSSLFFERLFKYSLWLALLCLAYSYWYKDRLPPPVFYQGLVLAEPRQTDTSKQPFSLDVNQQHYIITPKFDYALDGMVVSLNNADQLGNIWHHKRWKDFLNLRDLCVVWGNNLTGPYRDVNYWSDSWTCWVSWDSAAGRAFNGQELSNNHLLTDDFLIKQALMSAEIGDVIHLKGYLASYQNPGSNFSRGTSTRRDDTGNGACETIYLTDFNVVKKANVGLRRLYQFSLWWASLSFIFYLVFFVIAPLRRHQR